MPNPAAVDLYWIPLGAGGHSVRFNGRVFEAIAALRGHRPRCDLYHAALVVGLDGERHTIELAPSPDADETSRGVVATGPVGSRRLARLRLFRYEVRCWRGGRIPDLDWAVGGPQRLSADPDAARRVLETAAAVPTLVWGRDELGVGEMWNSNSLVAWAITMAGLSADAARLPAHGRAPGWKAGLVAARRAGGEMRAVPQLRPWVTAWLGGPVLGIANGVLRERLYASRLGDLRAHQASTGSAIAIFAAYYAWLQRRHPLPDDRTAAEVGAIWLALTVLFEFGFGRAVAREDWSELLRDYDVRRGRIWPVFLAWLALGPLVVRRVVGPS